MRIRRWAVPSDHDKTFEKRTLLADAAAAPRVGVIEKAFGSYARSKFSAETASPCALYSTLTVTVPPAETLAMGMETSAALADVVAPRTELRLTANANVRGIHALLLELIAGTVPDEVMILIEESLCFVFIAAFLVRRYPPEYLFFVCLFFFRAHRFVLAAPRSNDGFGGGWNFSE